MTILVALIAILAADGWRTSALAAIAAGAILTTRIRFSTHAAGALLALAALVAVSGHGTSA